MRQLPELIFLSLVLLALAVPGFSANTNIKLSADSIAKLVKESDLLDGEYKQQVYASVAGGVVSISMFRHPEATKADCKIDSVLLTRKVMEASKESFKLLRAVFYDFDHQNEYWSVEVRPELVRAFARGNIDEKNLIDSLILKEDKQENPLSAKFALLSYKSIVNLDTVCKGAYLEKRLAIHLRLEELSKLALDLSRFQEDFLRIEDAARRGENKELPQQISTLNSSLDKYLSALVASGQIQDPELRHSKSSLSSVSAAGSPSKKNQTDANTGSQRNTVIKN